MTREVEARLKLSAVDRTAKAFSAVQNRLRAVERQTTAFNRAQAAVGRTQAALYNGMGAAMARFAGPAVVGYAGYKMLQTASNLEDALFGIQKKTGASVEQMATIREQMQSLAREVPVSMDEIAAAFERGGASGIPLDQLREFAELSVKVSDAWDMSAEDVSNAFAGFSAGMGIQRGELEAYADLINSLADSGIADESGIVDFIDRVGASLKNFGLAKEEIAAYGAAMLNLKMPAETAARAMDTLTGKLIAPSNLSPKARSALQDVVGDLGKFSKAIEQDAGGALDSFFAKLEKFSSADRARILGGLLGEGFDDEVTRLVSGLGELRRNLELAKNAGDVIGSIDAAAERKVALWSSQVQILKSNLESISNTLGSPALAAANQILTNVNDSLDLEQSFSAGVAKEENRGSSEDDAFKEYRRRYEKIHGTTWQGGFYKPLVDSFKKDMASYGRGASKSPYAELDMLSASADLRSTQNRREIDRSAGVRKRDATIPIPTTRPQPGDDQRDQRALYGAGTQAMHEALRAANERNRRDTESFNPQGPGSQLPDVASELEAALSTGGNRLEEASLKANQNLVQGGEGSGSAFMQMLAGMEALGARSGSAFGAAAGSAFNATARVPAVPGGGRNTGTSMPDAGASRPNRGQL